MLINLLSFQLLWFLSLSSWSVDAVEADFSISTRAHYVVGLWNAAHMKNSLIIFLGVCLRQTHLLTHPHIPQPHTTIMWARYQLVTTSTSSHSIKSCTLISVSLHCVNHFIRVSINHPHSYTPHHMLSYHWGRLPYSPHPPFTPRSMVCSAYWGRRCGMHHQFMLPLPTMCEGFHSKQIQSEWHSTQHWRLLVAQSFQPSQTSLPSSNHWTSTT
jgi:hypothetical protein